MSSGPPRFTCPILPVTQRQAPSTAATALRRRILRRSSSLAEPQMPNLIELAIANSKQSSLTMQSPQTALASLVDWPLSGKKRSGSTPRQLAWDCQVVVDGGCPTRALIWLVASRAWDETRPFELKDLCDVSDRRVDLALPGRLLGSPSQTTTVESWSASPTPATKSDMSFSTKRAGLGGSDPPRFWLAPSSGSTIGNYSEEAARLGAVADSRRASRLALRIRRRSRSEQPPQMPNFSLLANAYSRHSD